MTIAESLPVDGATVSGTWHAIDDAPRAYFEAAGASVILVRSNSYLFGTASGPLEVGGLVDGLKRELRLTAVPAS